MHTPLRHAGAIAWKRRPIQLTYFVTRRCNARCPFCFYLQSAQPPAPPAPELDLDEIERLARNLGSLLWLAFSGGEIFLRREIDEISLRFYRHSRPAIMLYPTNGMLPELIRERLERIAAECPKSVVAVKLSLDGVGAAHDALRATPGSFERVLRSYRLLAPLLERYPNFELGINTVFCARNQDSIEEIMDFVAALPAPCTHTLSLVRGVLRDPDYLQVDIGKYRRAAERLAQRLRERRSPLHRFRGARLKAAQDVLQRRLIHDTWRADRQLVPCYAGRLNLVLGETGEVFPCETLGSSLGNVRDYGYDMRALLRAPPAGEARRAIATGACHCTHECNFITNILFNPRLYPALAREYLRIDGRGPSRPTSRTGS
jgi:MoaA/NifB/PqqE/SkfB family radical SAM enzyme